MSGIRARLLLLIVLTAGPLFLFTLYQGFEQRRRAADRERDDARRLVQLFAAEHRRVVSDARQILFVLAHVPAVRSADAAACEQVFRDVIAAAPAYGNILLAGPEGVLAAGRHPETIDDADRALLARAAASTFAAAPIRTPSHDRFPTLDVAHAVPGNAGPARALMARIAMQWVAEEFAVAGLGESTRVTLFDTSGRIVLRYPDPEGLLGRDASGSDLWAAIVAHRGEGTVEAAGGDGVLRLYGFTRLGRDEAAKERLTLSLGVPSHVAFANLRRLERRNLVILAILTAIATGVAAFGGERLVQLFGSMQRMAERDALTGLANRRHLRAMAEEELRRAQRFGHPLALLMLDLDHFKQVNDRHGHAAGDDVLREVARRVRDTVRKVDLPARFGGEEFAVLLPETSLETAREAAERIRVALADAPIQTRRGALPVTISGGVAVLREGDDLAGLLAAADAALYRAKSSGRNRVETAPPAK